MILTYKIIIGDSRDNPLDDTSVDLIITSPPYANIKDYDHPHQIGFHPNYSDNVEKYTSLYLEDLNKVWKGCYRILKPDCRMVINIGDVYLSSKEFGRYRILPIHANIITQCCQIGFDYMGSIIWQKISTTNASGGVNACFMGSFPHPRNGIIPFDYEYLMIFKKIGKSPSVVDEIKSSSELTKTEWIKYFKGHWKIKGDRQSKSSHIATFPLELPKRFIKMYSFMGDVVFDPFLGSGTTLLGAKETFRSCIGMELNKDYLPLIKKKTSFFQKRFHSDPLIEDEHYIIEI